MFLQIQDQLNELDGDFDDAVEDDEEMNEANMAEKRAKNKKV